MLRIPRCLDNRLTDGGKVVSPTHTKVGRKKENVQSQRVRSLSYEQGPAMGTTARKYSATSGEEFTCPKFAVFFLYLYITATCRFININVLKSVLGVPLAVITPCS
jgi:hypothetical protein